ncbi:hypothetical protein [Streptomyces sp. st115]|uniref:methylation-associated defense system protein MAD4 n=1 Tax=Streptomyces sp. st115 TaxID=1828047 RepID=UPI000BF0D5D0|nr:hypothetical protein [Streptomyces sp. st115]
MVFFVADRGMKAMIGAFLDRKDIHRKVGCGPFVFDGERDIKVSDNKDSELPVRAGALLQPWRGEYERAIVVMDHAYAGAPPVVEIRKRISEQLEDFWPQYEVVVIEPELENWFWSDHTEVIKKALVWRPRKGDERTPRQVLEDAGLWIQGRDKPDDPKGAVEYLHRLKYTGPKNNGIFRRFAEQVPSVRGCTDASFRQLTAALAAWFPPIGTTTAYMTTTTTEHGQ